MGVRATIRLDQCGLLSRRNAMLWCGQIGDERFDREVAPYCTPRYIGQERFYDLDDLRRWKAGLPIDRLGGTKHAAVEDDWDKLRNDLSKNRRHQAR